MAFKTEQVSTLLNGIVKQIMGQEQFAQVSAQGIVAMGETILSSATLTEAFFNTLVMRIGKTIIVNRAYENELGDMVLDDFTYGAIVQKIRTWAPEFVDDPGYELTNGQSVDQYQVYKPTVIQKFFVSRSPYMLPLTTSISKLEEAFLSYDAMGRFIASIMQACKNMLELGFEGLGRLCIDNFIAECSKVPGRRINLVGDYLKETGDTSLNPANPWFNSGFLRYMSATMRYTSDLFKSYSYKYGDGTAPNFTPKSRQKLKVVSRANIALETEVQYNAYHADMVSINGFETVNFWQNINNPMAINVETASGDAVELDNVVAVLYDRDALGIYKNSKRVLTSPVNAAGEYYNTFWHMKQLWFNDMSENGVIFTLDATPSPESDLSTYISRIRTNDTASSTLNNFIAKPPARSENSSGGTVSKD